MRLKQLAGDLLEFCYPSACAGCEAGFEGSGPLCPECADQLRDLEAAPACHACGAPLAEHGSGCQFCQGKGLPHYERIGRLGIFDKTLKELIHQIKYRNRWPLSRYLADQLFDHPTVRPMLETADCIVPIPLHPLRHIARGYNQAELIARRLARRARIKYAPAVIRIRNTPTQTHLHSRAQRAENLRDAFGVIKPKLVAGKRVIVMDDVMTTGATLHAAAQALVEIGPASLVAIVVAVADPRHQDFQVI